MDRGTDADLQRCNSLNATWEVSGTELPSMPSGGIVQAADAFAHLESRLGPKVTWIIVQHLVNGLLC
jgi:hypothetical protein